MNMKLITVDDYHREIERVEAALKKTESHFQKRDYNKYLKRLRGELSYALKKTGGWQNDGSRRI